MAFKFSTELRRQLCVSGSLKGILDGGLIRVYSGPVPSGPDSALSGNTLLCEVSASGANLTFNAAAPAGLLTKATGETWSGVNAANGTPSFFRYVKPADTGGASTGEVRVQGTTGGPSDDMTLSTPTFVLGATFTLDYFAMSLPEAT